MRVTVTGACGFVGRHVLDALRRAPGASPSRLHVVAFDRNASAPERADIEDRVLLQAARGDINSLGDIIAAVMHSDAVIHCDMPDALDNTNRQLMWSVNVEGTKNVIEACKQCRVRKLIYISTASVAFDGSHLHNVDESHPIPRTHLDAHAASKAAAERHVLDANRGSLATCALRPSALFGDGDHTLLPAFIGAARFGGTRFIIGRGTNIWDLTYVGNLAHACVAAMHRLEPQSPLAGQAYFITNQEPVPVWKFVARLLAGVGLEQPRLCLPYLVCYFVAVVLELTLFLLRPIYKPKRRPGLTRERVKLMVANRTFSCSKAMQHFGYNPVVSLDQAAERTIEYFKTHQSSLDELKRKDE